MNDADKESLKSHVAEALENEEIDPETAQDAHAAMRALAEVRDIFRGSRFEAIITEAMVVCDEVHRQAEKAFG